MPGTKVPFTSATFPCWIAMDTCWTRHDWERSSQPLSYDSTTQLFKTVDTFWLRGECLISNHNWTFFITSLSKFVSVFRMVIFKVTIKWDCRQKFAYITKKCVINCAFNILFVVTGAGPSFQRERTSTDIRVRCGHRPPSHARRAHMSPCQRWDKRSLRETEHRRALSVERNVLLRGGFDLRMRLPVGLAGNGGFFFELDFFYNGVWLPFCFPVFSVH